MEKKGNRVYVEREKGFDGESERLLDDIQRVLGAQFPETAGISRMRVLRRYDAAGLSDDQFRKAVDLIFSDPPSDISFLENAWEKGASNGNKAFFCVSFLAGQYDQRADSAEQCAELVFGTRPKVKTATLYVFEGKTLSEETLNAIKKYLINPVDSEEVSDSFPAFCFAEETPSFKETPVLESFSQDCALRKVLEMREQYGLAISLEDLLFCKNFFHGEKRDPTLAEMRVLDAYWSDHCRHTTFTTALEIISPDNADADLKNALDLYEAARAEVYGEAAQTRKRTLMDIALIGAKVLKKRGLAGDVDESAEINACTIAVTAEFADGSSEPYLLLFKNETHNHPTEIEPFGGAATCLGGAIRDPLSGRAFVHQAMRISGCGDPRAPLSETLDGKLPQIKIARESAAGYSSYGNQIGLATGQVAEFYHQGFLAKHLELGAVIGAVPKSWVRREEPRAGDTVILLGGKTGRDGIGGATGSSKAHTRDSVEKSGAEVQKGNPVEERKIQRLFRNPALTRLIKRCNDFGAGGVAVAVGELADGLDINLDLIPKKYAGLDGVELALSESQERMAVVTDAGDAEAFIALADAENLDAVVIAEVTAEKRLRMLWRGKLLVDLPRDFLNSNGAERKAVAELTPFYEKKGKEERKSVHALMDELERELNSLRSGSRRGLQERFDGSIGAGSVLFPFAGAEQGTPECGMAALLPSLDKESVTASLMTFGYDPETLCADAYRGAKGAVREALAKYACLGGDIRKARLSFQEYFDRPDDPTGWGKPASALLGALESQLALGVPAIGGKDSMSGGFFYKKNEEEKRISVPPTLVAFSAGVVPAGKVRSGALSGAAGNMIVLFFQDPSQNEWEVFKQNLDALAEFGGKALAAQALTAGGIAATVALMAFGNKAGVELAADALNYGYQWYQGSIIAEIESDAENILQKAGACRIVGKTLDEAVFRISDKEGAAESPLAMLRRAYEFPLSGVYPQVSSGVTVLDGAKSEKERVEKPFTEKKRVTKREKETSAAPLVLLPVFPGTNCEWDMERSFRTAGAAVKTLVFRNRTREAIAESIDALAREIEKAQIIALSGGFSAGDEPDGSGKFIANVFRSPRIKEAVSRFLERDRLILGICNGFQALVKLGLLPYGEFRDAHKGSPVLTFNRVGRHISRIVRTRVMPNNSPWLSLEETGALRSEPVSHGEGRFVISAAEGKSLFEKGQVAFCYADENGNPAESEPDNPNGSSFAIEGITSPNGRVLGKMAHSERAGKYVHINIPADSQYGKSPRIFSAGVDYFSNAPQNSERNPSTK